MHSLLKRPISEIFSLVNNLDFCQKTNPEAYLHLVHTYRNTLQKVCTSMESMYYQRVILPQLSVVIEQVPLTEPDVYDWYLPYVSLCLAFAFSNLHPLQELVIHP